jgi:Flp pilus assembly protein TadD
VPSAAPVAAATPSPGVAGPAAVAVAAAVPPSPETAARLETANTHFERGRRAQALAAYEDVLAHDPASAIAFSRIAHLHLEAGDDALARKYAARAVELDATSSEGWIVLGAALQALRDRAGARAAYQQCAAVGVGAYAAECRRLAR